ncbi:MAG: LPS assembly protein LptD [Alphaproteobacteria bacterium]|nr:LPS assembly protein LptD [Alphaproteobacteria bacterium]
MRHLLAILFFATAASAQQTPITVRSQAILFDRNTNSFTAIGGVDMRQDTRTLTADSIEFDADTGDMKIDGAIDIRDQQAKITTRDLGLNTRNETGALGMTIGEFGDTAAFRSARMEMTSFQNIVFYDSEYSACKSAFLDCDETPTWKLSASRITHNAETGQLFYRNMFFYMWDVPVFWLPFFSNYAPSAGSKTGLLTPTVSMSSIFGVSYKQPAYIALGKHHGLSLTPILSTRAGMLYEGEYMTKQTHFDLRLTGNYKPNERESISSEMAGQDRWFYQVRSNIEFDDVWRARVDLNRTSDDTYLRKYGYNSDPWLTSSVHLEGSRRNSFLTMDTYSYQDLRHVPDGFSPTVLPLVNYYRTNGYDDYGFFDLNVNTARVERNFEAADKESEEYNRLSGNFKYTVPMKTAGGHLFDVSASARGDAYYLKNVNDEGGGEEFTGNRSRDSVQAGLRWRYPLISQGGHILEPQVQFLAAPRDSSMTHDDIPNMDSKFMELNAENLFSDNRYAGYDMYETGTRANYGLRYTAGKSIFFLGQNYNFSTPDNLYAPGSGLKNESGASDILGEMRFLPHKYFSMQYNTRIDNETMTANAQELVMRLGPPALALRAGYVYQKDIEIENEIPNDREELHLRLESQITPTLSMFVANRYDVKDSKTLQTEGGIRFHNECFAAALTVLNNYTKDRDYRGERAIAFTLTFTTLGEVGYKMNVDTDESGIPMRF